LSKEHHHRCKKLREERKIFDGQPKLLKSYGQPTVYGGVVNLEKAPWTKQKTTKENILLRISVIAW
jgi:hypothetical protein